MGKEALINILPCEPIVVGGERTDYKQLIREDVCDPFIKKDKNTGLWNLYSTEYGQQIVRYASHTLTGLAVAKREVVFDADNKLHDVWAAEVYDQVCKEKDVIYTCAGTEPGKNDQVPVVLLKRGDKYVVEKLRLPKVIKNKYPWGIDASPITFDKGKDSFLAWSACEDPLGHGEQVILIARMLNAIAVADDWGVIARSDVSDSLIGPRVAEGVQEAFGGITYSTHHCSTELYDERYKQRDPYMNPTDPRAWSGGDVPLAVNFGHGHPLTVGNGPDMLFVAHSKATKDKTWLYRNAYVAPCHYEFGKMPQIFC